MDFHGLSEKKCEKERKGIYVGVGIKTHTHTHRERKREMGGWERKRDRVRDKHE